MSAELMLLDALAKFCFSALGTLAAAWSCSTSAPSEPRLGCRRAVERGLNRQVGHGRVQAQHISLWSAAAFSSGKLVMVLTRTQDPR